MTLSAPCSTAQPSTGPRPNPPPTPSRGRSFDGWASWSRLPGSTATVCRPNAPTRPTHPRRYGRTRPLGSSPPAWTRRCRRLWRSLPRLGHAPRPRGRAEAPHRSAGETARARSSRKAGFSPRSAIRTSSPSMAPSKSAAGSGSGWNSSAARRSRQQLQQGTGFERRTHRHRRGALSRGVRCACSGTAPSRHQGAERHARGRRTHRAHGFRRRQGAGRHSTSDVAGTPLTWRPKSWPAVRRRCRATSTAWGCCSITLSRGRILSGAEPSRNSTRRTNGTSVSDFARCRPDVTSDAFARVIERA